VNGPEKIGFWSSVAGANIGRRPFGHLVPGVQYVVSREFVDYDGDIHLVGEAWIYLGTSSFPYDDGISLFVSMDSCTEWQIRMQWRPESQLYILEELEKFVIIDDSCPRENNPPN
jgi:hypothetical protein